MTPQERMSHKRRWRMASHFVYHTHTDLRSESKEWCKRNCEQHEWDIKQFTDIYGDTIRFEFEEHFNEFSNWYNERWSGV